MPNSATKDAGVTVEILYFEGCPNHEALLLRLGELLEHAVVATAVELVEVADDEAARRQRFLGSPTLRVDGRDVEPGADARADYGLKCRVYRTPHGLGGVPSDEWILAALTARARAKLCTVDVHGLCAMPAEGGLSGIVRRTDVQGLR